MSITPFQPSHPAQLYTGRKYCTVYADPPWDKNQKGALGAGQHYPLMTIDRIKGMGSAIQAMAADDAFLLLWTTSSAWPEALEVVKAWGFKYHGQAVWDKDAMGLGSVFRNSHEPLVVATRGKPKAKFHGQKSVVRFPRQDHSHKPEEMFPLIERMFDGPYLELFARRRPNSLADWDYWGNEFDATVSLAPWGYPVPSDLKHRKAA